MTVHTATVHTAPSKCLHPVSTPTKTHAHTRPSFTNSPLTRRRYPLRSADRREYQLFVHVLMSVAMLTGRLPVLPLAFCNDVGEWAWRSRCVYVLHAQSPKDERFCVMRPPSPCHGKIALPASLQGIGAEEVVVAALPALGLRNASVDVASFAHALGDTLDARDKKLLLIDPTDLQLADDISTLLATPKGWLCTLEHKSCQHTC